MVLYAWILAYFWDLVYRLKDLTFKRFNCACNFVGSGFIQKKGEEK
jgi:hypothetical protein